MTRKIDTPPRNYAEETYLAVELLDKPVPFWLHDARDGWKRVESVSVYPHGGVLAQWSVKEGDRIGPVLQPTDHVLVAW